MSGLQENLKISRRSKQTLRIPIEIGLLLPAMQGLVDEEFLSIEVRYHIPVPKKARHGRDQKKIFEKN